jgi:hypothetical protein
MTSDAKIGLLLGLVFIFVIAFVINGLPSLRPPTVGKVEVTTIAGEDFEAGVAGKAETVPNLNELLDQQRTAGEPAPVAVEPPKPAVPETPQPSGPLASGPQTSQPATASDEGVRFSTALSGIGKLLDQLPVMVPPNRGGTFMMDTPKPAPDQPVAGEHQPVAAASQPRVESPSEPKPAEMLTKATNVSEPGKPAPVAPKPVLIPGSKAYVVVAGDNLPAISKKVYGPEEGTGRPTTGSSGQFTVLESPGSKSARSIIPPPCRRCEADDDGHTAQTTTTPANPNKPADMLPRCSSKVGNWESGLAPAACDRGGPVVHGPGRR